MSGLLPCRVRAAVGTVLRWASLGALLAFAPRTANAHVWNMTRVHVTFADARHCTVRLDLDLTRGVGSAADYYALTQADRSTQQQRISALFAAFWPRFNFRAGDTPLRGELTAFRLPAGDRREFGYVGIGKMTTLEAAVALPSGSVGPLWFAPDNELPIEYPLSVTFEVTSQDLNVTRWLDAAGPSRRFDYVATLAATPAASQRQVTAAESKLDLSEGEAAAMSVLLTVWRYLHLGFRHIFPTGADHILFVVGLFFLGIDWRKLLTQTTVFTIAHTTTLGLSACGIFSLPAWFVEPAIAGSIAFVAIENIVRPRLTSARLIIVFLFGLIHGLGFAGSLAEIGLPKKEFWVALLSFNFGVDFGQLFILACCFLTFGSFRQQIWFRPRVVVPVCALVALVGLTWAAQRIVHYAALA